MRRDGVPAARIISLPAPRISSRIPACRRDRREQRAGVAAGAICYACVRHQNSEAATAEHQRRATAMTATILSLSLRRPIAAAIAADPRPRPRAAARRGRAHARHRHDRRSGAAGRISTTCPMPIRTRPRAARSPTASSAPSTASTRSSSRAASPRRAACPTRYSASWSSNRCWSAAPTSPSRSTAISPRPSRRRRTARGWSSPSTPRRSSPTASR